ncbi:uncharacterized protein [Phyllobates terribilis]|uniref:uncharacterized protein isoform X2 n=1 Tax=Phyllobates terribilis TaxID=111132 RepID=UPI003CCAA10A
MAAAGRGKEKLETPELGGEEEGEEEMESDEEEQEGGSPEGTGQSSSEEEDERENEAEIQRLEEQHRQQDLSTTRSDDIPGSEPSEGSSEEPAPSTVPRRLTNSHKKRKATLSPSPDLVSLANQILMQQTNTGMDSFANFAADRLRKLDDRQRIHAERVIFETLCKAAAGQLNETSIVNSRNVDNQYEVV